MTLHLPLGLIRHLDRLTLQRSLALPPVAQRRRVEQLAVFAPMPAGVSVSEVSFGGVPCERITHPADDRGTLLYLHGGGYIVGSPRTHRALAARLALAAGVQAIVPDYRLAPEHPCPAGLDDALACFRAAASLEAGEGRVAVAGDSAGGGLALALAQALRESGGDGQPVGVGVISPWVDLTVSGESTRSLDGVDAVLTLDYLLSSSSHYAGDLGHDDPRVSPLFGELAGLPPVLIQTGAEELFVSENRELATRIEAAGGHVTYQELDRCWHDIHLHAGTLREADLAVAAMGAWLADQLSRN